MYLLVVVWIFHTNKHSCLLFQFDLIDQHEVEHSWEAKKKKKKALVIFKTFYKQQINMRNYDIFLFSHLIKSYAEI